MGKVFRYDFKKISATEKFVLLAIAEYAKKETYQANVHPEVLSEYCSLSISCIYNTLQKLKKKRLITVFFKDIKRGHREYFIELHPENMFKHFAETIDALVDNSATEFHQEERLMLQKDNIIHLK